MICNEKSTNCFLGLCNKCPGITNIIDQLERNFEDKLIENVKLSTNGLKLRIKGLHYEP